MNILYLNSHDTGRLVQPYGHAVPTPRMQRLAEEGTLFRQAFCAAPTCSPSRAALMTGKSPHEAGLYGLAHLGFDVADTAVPGLLPVLLARRGYRTVCTGVQHFTARRTEDAGYTDVLNHWPDSMSSAKVAERAAGWLAAEGAKGPFFLDAGFVDTHLIGCEAGRGSFLVEADHGIGPGDVDTRYVTPPPPMPDTPETRRDMAEFKVSAAHLDRCYGVVLDALERAGLAGDTLVICTTDHGPPFPRMKCNLTGGGLGVLLICRWPGFLPPGTVSDALVSHLDVLPTVCEAAGFPAPAGLRGKSLAATLAGGEGAGHEAVFGEVSYHAAIEPMRSVRDKRWSYIRRYDGRARPVLPNTDASSCKDLWMEAGWSRRDPPGEALYDLRFDPHEMDNLAGDSGYAGVLETMRGKLGRWQRETGDPLFFGDAIPAGPKVREACSDPDIVHHGLNH